MQRLISCYRTMEKIPDNVEDTQPYCNITFCSSFWQYHLLFKFFFWGGYKINFKMQRTSRVPFTPVVPILDRGLRRRINDEPLSWYNGPSSIILKNRCIRRNGSLSQRYWIAWGIFLEMCDKFKHKNTDRTLLLKRKPRRSLSQTHSPHNPWNTGVVEHHGMV